MVAVPSIFLSTQFTTVSSKRFTRMTAWMSWLWIGVCVATAGEPNPATISISLQEVADQAVQHNLGLKIDRYQEPIAAEEVEQAEAAFQTTLTASGHLRSREVDSTSSATTGTKSDYRIYSAGAARKFSTGATVEATTSLSRSDSNAFTNFSSLDYSSDIGLSVRQPLLKGAGQTVNLAPVRQAESRRDEARWQYRKAVADLLSEAESTYWDLSYAQSNKELRQSSVAAAETLLEEALERQRLGLVTEVEVLQARAALASRQEAMVLATQQIADSRDRLGAAMGQLLPDDILTWSGEIPAWQAEALSETVPDPPGFVPLWQRTLAWDPGLAMQNEVIRRSELDVQSARNDRLPSIDLVTGASLLGRDNRHGLRSWENAAEADGHSWNVGIEVAYPWDRRGERARERQSQITLEREQVRLIRLKEDLFQRTRSAWRDLQTSRDRLLVTTASLDLQVKNHAQQLARYKSGLATLREVLEAQRDLDDARLQRLDAVRNLARAQLALSRLDGSLLGRLGFSWHEGDRPVP